MGGLLAPPDRDPFAFCLAAWIIAPQGGALPQAVIGQCDNSDQTGALGAKKCNKREPLHCERHLGATLLATEKELSDFLKSVEKRAFKRSVYHVRDEEAALDIVQDSMIKLAEHYGDKPVAELPMLFQRILSNTTLDWFRRQKTRKALFSNMSDFESASDDGDFNLLETLEEVDSSEKTESAEDSTSRAQILHEIELEIQELPGRQREAFLMRYWEEMDVAETAAAMGCSEGSVKTHCSRAVQALSKALKAKGIKL
jgi:RNA polymerase sigma-70 factor (ECF subfamily)